MGCSLEKKIENIIQVEIDKHERDMDGWLTVEVEAIQRDIKREFGLVVRKIREWKGLIENIDYEKLPDDIIHGAALCPESMASLLGLVLGLLVEDSQEREK